MEGGALAFVGGEGVFVMPKSKLEQLLSPPKLQWSNVDILHVFRALIGS